MKHLLVGFHVDDPSRSSAVQTLIFQHASAWRNLLPSTFMVCTQSGPQWWAHQIQQIIDPKQDRFFVFQLKLVGWERNGWLPAEAWAWLEEHSKYDQQ